MIDTTTTELARLAEWLRAQGFSAEKVLECLDYIARTSKPKHSSKPKE